MSQVEAVLNTGIKNTVKEPSLFKVIYVNDNTTTVEFVIGSLIDYFDYNEETATNLTVQIHESGSATVAVLPFEIAEQKGHEITQLARSQNMPLQIRLEPDKN